MADILYFADLTAIVTVDPASILAVQSDPTSGIKGFKLTLAQAKDFVNAGLTGGKTIEGGTAASEELVLDSTAHATKGKVRVGTGSDFESEVVDFNTSPTQSAQEARAFWNAEAGTVSIGMPGGTGTLEVGQEFMLSNRPKNVEGVQIDDGQVVVISGAAGAVLEMVLVNAGDFPAAGKTIAVATEDIPNNQRGRYTTNGMVRDIKTDYPTWSEGQELWLDTTDGEMTNVMPSAPNVAVRIGYITRVHGTEGDIFVAIDVDRTAITKEIKKDPSGFTDNENIVVTYDDSTRKITLSGTVNGYWRGQPVSAITNGWVSDAHPAGNDFYFLTYDGTAAVWVDAATFDISDLSIAFVSYGAVDKFALRECHGFMPWESHKEFHNVIGTFKSSGGTPADYVVDSTTAADRRPSMSTTVVVDEDLPTTNSALPANGPYTQFTLSASGTVNFDKTGTDIVELSGNQPYWNEFTGGAWQKTLMSNNFYSSIWVIAMPTTQDGGSTESQKYRYFWIMGQNESALESTQVALATGSVNLGELNNITQEAVFISQFIIRFQAANWTISQVRELTGTRRSQTSTPQGDFLTVVESDGTLSGNGTVSDPLSVVDGDVEQANTYFVNKSGNDSNNGLREETALLTIGEANTKIAALTGGDVPSLTNPYKVKGIGGGDYVEDFTELAYVTYDFSGASMGGNITCVAGSTLDIWAFNPPTTGAKTNITMSGTQADGTDIYIRSHFVSGETAGINNTSTGTVYMHFDKIWFFGGSLIPTSNTGDIKLIGNEILIDDTTATCFNINSSMSLQIICNRIHNDDITGSNTTLAATGACFISIHCNEWDARGGKNYALTSGPVMDLICNDFKETVASTLNAADANSQLSRNNGDFAEITNTVNGLALNAPSAGETITFNAAGASSSMNNTTFAVAQSILTIGESILVSTKQSFVDLTTTPVSITGFNAASQYDISLQVPGTHFGAFTMVTGLETGTGYTHDAGTDSNLTVVESPAGTFTLTVGGFGTSYVLTIDTGSNAATLETSAGTATGTTILKMFRITP